jgi:hypothetical protein
MLTELPLPPLDDDDDDDDDDDITLNEQHDTRSGSHWTCYG